MSGGDVAQREHKGKGKKKKARRLGIRIDMTPLVDVALLLLTFFMYTTSMSRPQTMEINLPPDKEVKVEIAESNLLTLRINTKGEIFWNAGIESPKRLDPAERHKFLREKSQGNPKLTTLVKVDREGRYEMLVNIIDDLNGAGIQRFSIAPLLDADKALLARVKL